jgi:hypothetical protein
VDLLIPPAFAAWKTPGDQAVYGICSLGTWTRDRQLPLPCRHPKDGAQLVPLSCHTHRPEVYYALLTPSSQGDTTASVLQTPGGSMQPVLCRHPNCTSCFYSVDNWLMEMSLLYIRNKLWGTGHGHDPEDNWELRRDCVLPCRQPGGDRKQPWNRPQALH